MVLMDDLRGADLRGVKVADHQLADTLSLQGATMTYGQKYEDGIKSKVRAEDG
jgi:hypothetical protein